MEQFPKKEIETLWAPWRVEYFEKEPRDMEFLTAAAQASDDAAHLVIARRKTAFLMMNRYPYSVGHLMAVPYRKTAEISSLGENEIVELWNLVTHAQAMLRAATRAQGFNVGLNLGECAGAGVVDHLHIHIVPRWKGDTNFMPVLAGTKTISEELHALYDKLIEAQTKMEKERARSTEALPGSNRRRSSAGSVALPKVVSFSLFFSFCSVWPLSAALISQRNICGLNIFPRI